LGRDRESGVGGREGESMKPEILALISALGRIVIGTIGNVVISVFTKRYEHKREIKRLIVTSAMEQWKEMLSLLVCPRLLVPFPLFSTQFDIRRRSDLSSPTMG
jgi:hypothetical protein